MEQGEIRRIVTGHDQSGKAIVLLDGANPYKNVRPGSGTVARLLWVTAASRIDVSFLRIEIETRAKKGITGKIELIEKGGRPTGIGIRGRARPQFSHPSPCRRPQMTPSSASRSTSLGLRPSNSVSTHILSSP